MSRIVTTAHPGSNPDSPLDLGEIQQLPLCDREDLLMGRLIRLESAIKGTKHRLAGRARELAEMVESITHNPEVVANRAAGLAEDGALYQARETQRRQTQAWLDELGIEDWR